MLTHLTIRNYALIDHLEINPSANLNIITGETGAGKSIMLGAVGLLMGNRADSSVLLNKEQKCIVEGEFDIEPYNLKSFFEKEELDYETQSIFRREISPTGKSRAFLNDTPVTLDILKRIGLKLMDVHSQHQTLNLSKQNFQLAFIDAYSGTTQERIAYSKAFKDYQQAENAHKALISENESINQEYEYDNFQLEELIQAKLVANEQEELETSLKVLEHAEEIKTKLNEVLLAISTSDFSMVNSIQQAKVLLNQLSKFGAKYSDFHNRIESLAIEINDIIREVEVEEESIEFDPDKIAHTQDRISLIYNLQQKHGVSDITALLDIQSKLEEKIVRVSNLEGEIEKSKIKVAEMYQVVTKKSRQLSEERKKHFPKIESELHQLLGQVGISQAVVKIESEETQPSASGVDHINILFSANKGIVPQELSKVASGGEFSRFMFCIKYILAGKVALPTIIFDEIDAGVSGEIALKLGTLMKKMAAEHQVITISHLPQMAAKGDKHYFVFKDNSNEKAVSKIKELTDDERIDEIAKMIGGDKPSTIALENARELMQAE